MRNYSQKRFFFFVFQVSFKGLTGDVRFDGDSGERMVQDGMDILNVLPEDVKKVQCNCVSLIIAKCVILDWENRGR